MMLFTNLIILLNDMSKKEFYRNGLIALGLLFAFIAGSFYYYFTETDILKSKIARLNKQRISIKKLLEEHTKNSFNRKEIDTILTEEKDFRILNFFETTLKETDLSTALKGNLEPTESVFISKQYAESKLIASFKQITMQQIYTLLEALQKKSRIYIKEITLVKTKGATVDATITIATLKPLGENESVK